MMPFPGIFIVYVLSIPGDGEVSHAPIPELSGIFNLGSLAQIRKYPPAE